MFSRKNNFFQSFKKLLRKKYLVRILLMVWIAFSLSYIAYDQWTAFKNNALQKAYMAGQADFVRGFITEANKDTCDVITVFSEDEEVGVINVECLKAEMEE